MCSMYGICTNICPKNHPNVSKYSIHGYTWIIWVCVERCKYFTGKQVGRCFVISHSAGRRRTNGRVQARIPDWYPIYMRISIYNIYHYFVNQNYTLLAVVILSFDWNLSLFSLVSQKLEAEAGCFDFAELTWRAGSELIACRPGPLCSGRMSWDMVRPDLGKISAQIVKSAPQDLKASWSTCQDILLLLTATVRPGHAA